MDPNDLAETIKEIKANRQLSTSELVERLSKIFIEYQAMLTTKEGNGKASSYLARHFGELDLDFGLYFVPFIDMLEKKGLKEPAEIQKNLYEIFRKNIQDYKVTRVSEIANNASKVAEGLSKNWRSKVE